MENKRMKVIEMIKELRRLGYRVTYRKRTDGGYLITKINGKTYSAAKGNTYARELLGVELSKARQEALTYNVEKLIRGQKKTRRLDKEMKRKLEKVQKKWRKYKVHAKITSRKVKEHLQKEGRQASIDYLDKMMRYGTGLAYLDNVEYLAQYIEDTAISVNDSEYKEAIIKCAEFVRSKAEIFREEWIHRVYEVWYAVRNGGYDYNDIYKAIMFTYGLIG